MVANRLRDWPFRTYDFALPLRYRLTGRGPGLVICLHGYQDHALSLLKRLDWLDRADLPFRVLAINAPFPVPIWGPKGFTEAYAWYFRDTTSGFEVTGPAAVAHALARLLKDLDVAVAPTVIFGFSQGAYLAPWLARAREIALPTRAIIGFGGGFPRETYAGLAHVPVFGVHGEDDDRVPCAGARAEHLSLVDAGFGGTFTALPRVRHRVTAEVEALVRRIAEEYLS